MGGLQSPTSHSICNPPPQKIHDNDDGHDGGDEEHCLFAATVPFCWEEKPGVPFSSPSSLSPTDNEMRGSNPNYIHRNKLLHLHVPPSSSFSSFSSSSSSFSVYLTPNDSPSHSNSPSPSPSPKMPPLPVPPARTPLFSPADSTAVYPYRSPSRKHHGTSAARRREGRRAGSGLVIAEDPFLMAIEVCRENNRSGGQHRRARPSPRMPLLSMLSLEEEGQGQGRIRVSEGLVGTKKLSGDASSSSSSSSPLEEEGMKGNYNKPIKAHNADPNLRSNPNPNVNANVFFPRSSGCMGCHVVEGSIVRSYVVSDQS